MCSKPGQYHQTLGGAQSAMAKGTNEGPADQREDMFGGAWRVLSSTTDRPSRFRKPSRRRSLQKPSLFKKGFPIHNLTNCHGYNQ
jgi:hypothetical protein